MNSPADRGILLVGPGLESSRAAMIMVHGRNAGPENILSLAGELRHPEFSYLAPAAPGGTWYPRSFMAEIADNEPALSDALASIDGVVRLIAEKGIPRERIILLGFSQGACLSAEYTVRRPARYGGVMALSGGLIGPPGTRWEHPGDFGGTPVLLGCSDVDPHIPRSRVAESAVVFGRMGAEVTERIYPGMGHQVNEDELEFVRAIMTTVAADSAG
jgi:predicted esterase